MVLVFRYTTYVRTLRASSYLHYLVESETEEIEAVSPGPGDFFDEEKLSLVYTEGKEGSGIRTCVSVS